MRRLIKFAVPFLLLLVAVVAIGALGIVRYFSADLPDYSHLANYNPPVVTRFYAGDGRLLAEVASERRVYVPISAIPKRVINAFLSAEDKNFYNHSGINPLAIARAAITNIGRYLTGKRPIGASTITQQVARYMFLTNEVSYRRKIIEMILASRLEKVYSKDRILELYLNEIFFWNRAYGVAEAAVAYFNKSLDELTIAEAAYLATIPKSPNGRYDPVTNRELTYDRRNWVVSEMLANGFITKEEAKEAMKEEIVLRPRTEEEKVEADYFAEEVRRELVTAYGDKSLYEGGLVVRTTVDNAMQNAAVKALRQGLINYDRRHGWRGPLKKIPLQVNTSAMAKTLSEFAHPLGGELWQLAVVQSVDKSGANIVLADTSTGTIPLSELKWARKPLKNGYLGGEISNPSQVLSVGDVILTEKLAKQDKEGSATLFGLRQIPAVQGGMVALDPHTGRVLAMVGGFSSKLSVFNRATQAMRQPGSSFKPFVYLTALENGFTPSSLLLDAPLVLEQGNDQPIWKPANYTEDFLGPSTLRTGVEKSRNLMTIRLAHSLGMEKIVENAQKFGVSDNLQPVPAMALGAGETTVLRMATAYSMFVNGGKQITPSIIDRIQDRFGKTIYRHDLRECANCNNLDWKQGVTIPDIPDTREVIVDPKIAYQMVSIMEGVVQRGTGVLAAVAGRPLAGKTGTSNDAKDAWFIGFSPDLAVGIYVGFDEPKSLGDRETGGSVSAPIFHQFMTTVLADKPAMPFRVPSGIRLVRVRPDTGRLAAPGDKGTIWEAFLPGTEPTTVDDTEPPPIVSTEGPIGKEEEGKGPAIKGLSLDKGDVY